MAHKWAYEREKEKKAKIWNRLHEEDEKTEDMVWRAKWGETKLEKYPYRPNTGQKVSGHTDMITTLTHQPDYARRAAAGWAQHQSDQAHRQAVLRDPAYQKWQQARGSAIEDDEDWYPKEDWNSSQNNHFGYLYSKNPWEARSYATLVNRENRWGKEIGSQQVRTSMPTKPNFLDRAADFLTDAWNRNAQAESVNSGMSMEQGLKTGEKARKVFDSAGQALAAQSEMNRQAADGAAKNIVEVVVGSVKSVGDLAGAQANMNLHTFDRSADDSYKKPNSHWSSDQIKEYLGLKRTNSEEANIFAIEINESINKEKQRANLEESNHWATKNVMNGVLGTTSALILEQFRPVEAADTIIEIQTNGTKMTNPDGRPSDYATAMKNAIADSLDSLGKIPSSVPYIGGKGLGDVYSSAFDVTGEAITNALPFGKVINVVSEWSKSFDEAYEEARQRGADQDTALRYGKHMARGKGVSDSVVEKVMQGVSNGQGDKAVGVLGEMIKSGAQNIIARAIENSPDWKNEEKEFESQKNSFLQQGYSEKEAEKRALQGMSAQVGEEVEKNLLDGLLKGIFFG